MMTAGWDRSFLERSSVYDPLRRAARALGGPDWPTLADLQRLLAGRATTIVSGGSAPIRFVAAGRKRGRLEQRYEPRIFLRGEVPVRSRSWHDLFNALVWLTFPLAKAALNARHYEALRAGQATAGSNRAPVQDALTLFDESGMIIAATSSDLLDLVKAFAWKELFWRQRARVRADMRFYLFGHALYEKMLTPYRGITARATLLDVDPGFVAEPRDRQLELVDAAVARRLLDPERLCSTRELPPVPVLGVPGWHEPNGNASFYDDAEYFRAGRITR